MRAPRQIGILLQEEPKGGRKNGFESRFGTLWGVDAVTAAADVLWDRFDNGRNIAQAAGWMLSHSSIMLPRRPDSMGWAVRS